MHNLIAIAVEASTQMERPYVVTRGAYTGERTVHSLAALNESVWMFGPWESALIPEVLVMGNSIHPIALLEGSV